MSQPVTSDAARSLINGVLLMHSRKPDRIFIARPIPCFFASLLPYGTATLTVVALISAISSSLGMSVLPGILSREIICGLPRIRKKLFVCRRERWHPNRVGIRQAHSQLAPACEHHTGRRRPIASFRCCAATASL